jgi:acyl-CoA thioesterase I
MHEPFIFSGRYFILAASCMVSAALMMHAFSDSKPGMIRYAAIGDSYSIGEGATEEESWPAVLARHLQAQGFDIKLVANPSRTGWTTQDAIDSELPVFIKARPDFATLQIGVNDWVQGVQAVDFEKRLAALMDAMLAALPDKNRLLVVTIPDFSVTPAGAQYGGGRDISKGIAEFNAIIIKQAKLRNLKVVDVYELSRRMRDDKGLVAADGLHPSAAEYAAWEKVIFPAVGDLLKPGN